MLINEMNIYELVMLVAFGSSWPFAVYKTFRTKKVEGKSGIFLVFIFLGYVSGIIYKCTTKPDLVLALYVVNGSMVLTEIVLMATYSQFFRQNYSTILSRIKSSFKVNVFQKIDRNRIGVSC